MKKITVTLSVDESVVKTESGLDNLDDAIRQELGWLHDSGMSVENWAYDVEKDMQTEKEASLPAEEKPASVFFLCEEFEDKDGIREFYIRVVSTEKDQLRKLLSAKIKADEYGFIAQKGISEHRADHFCTNFVDGFVEYYILEENVLSRSELDLLIQSEVRAPAEEGKKVSLSEQIANAKASVGQNRAGENRQPESEQGRE